MRIWPLILLALFTAGCSKTDVQPKEITDQQRREQDAQQQQVDREERARMKGASKQTMDPGQAAEMRRK